MRNEMQTCIRATQEEYLLLKNYALLYNISIGELLRSCTLTNFLDYQVLRKREDILSLLDLKNDLVKEIKKTEKILNEAIFKNKKYIYDNELLTSEQKAIKVYLLDLLNKTDSLIKDFKVLYDTIGDMREEYFKVIEKKIQENKEEYNPEVSAGNKQIRFRIEKKDFIDLELAAANEGLSISKLLKRNVFIKCKSERKILIDVYDCENLAKDIFSKVDLMRTINYNIEMNGIKLIDMRKISNLIKDIKDMIDMFYNEINFNKNYIENDALSYLD